MLVYQSVRIEQSDENVILFLFWRWISFFAAVFSGTWTFLINYPWGDLFSNATKQHVQDVLWIRSLWRSVKFGPTCIEWNSFLMILMGSDSLLPRFEALLLQEDLSRNYVIYCCEMDHNLSPKDIKQGYKYSVCTHTVNRCKYSKYLMAKHIEVRWATLFSHILHSSWHSNFCPKNNLRPGWHSSNSRNGKSQGDVAWVLPTSWESKVPPPRLPPPKK